MCNGYELIIYRLATRTNANLGFVVSQSPGSGKLPRADGVSSVHAPFALQPRHYGEQFTLGFMSHWAQVSKDKPLSGKTWKRAQAAPLPFLA